MRKNWANQWKVKKKLHDLYDIMSQVKIEPPKETPADAISKKEAEPEIIIEQESEAVQEEEIKITFAKKLNPREEAIFEYFSENKGKIVFAKELAKVLNLPTDYVYKYIKNLREKLGKEVLANADPGGYVLNM